MVLTVDGNVQTNSEKADYGVWFEIVRGLFWPNILHEKIQTLLTGIKLAICHAFNRGIGVDLRCLSSE
jgi:hypothetical protein